MADDEFDIDIYGDTNPEEGGTFRKDEEGDTKIDEVEGEDVAGAEGNGAQPEDDDPEDEYVQIDVGEERAQNGNGQQQIKSTDESGQDVLSIPKQAPQQQGVKRKGGSDDRPIDPGATTALLISELHWWNTDDDVRGWVNQAQVEDELKDITFSEHKVNGKSKGQAYIEFTSQQAATVAKHKIDAFGEGQQYAKKHTVTYSNPNINPFRTLPKDAPARGGKDGQSHRGGSSSYNSDRSNQSGGNYNPGFRGRTPGYNSSRGGMNNMNQHNFNRNFSTPAMGNMGVGFGPQMGGFQGNHMSGQFGGGFNRGGMMSHMRGGPNMRGGRGGMGGGMMGGMGNMGMPMGGMGSMGGMPMNMGHMGGGMQGMTRPIAANGQLFDGGLNAVGKAYAFVPNVGQPSGPYIPRQAGQQAQSPHHMPGYGYAAAQSAHHTPPLPHTNLQQYQAEQAKQKPNSAGAGGFQGQMPHFNPAFFQQNQAAGGDWQNPHGAKRPRPE